MSFICQKTKRNYKQKKKRIVKELNGAENFITYPVGAYATHIGRVRLTVF